MKNQTSICQARRFCALSKAILLWSLLAACCSSSMALTLYRDDFQSYPVQNPAPSPLTNGPAGGQWYYVDPDATFTANEHRIWDSTTVGAGLNSRVWITLTNNARLTNALSLNLLPPGGSHTLKLSFVVAADTYDTTRNVTFAYNFAATAGTLSFVSGGNADGSQVLAGISGTATASAGIKGKSADRTFEFVFQTDNISSADRFIFDLTRITNNAGGAVNFLLDDVELTLVETTNAPVVLAVTPVFSLQHARITFSEPLDPASATNIANYTIAGLSVFNAWMLDSRRVEIQTAEQTSGTTYSVQVSGVTGQNGTTVPTKSVSFTAPAMAGSSVKYDAGTTATQPSGPPDPTSADGHDWTVNVNTQAGMTKEAVYDDLGTGLNAWKITDNNGTGSGGSIVYSVPVDPVSDMFARSNGWRMVLRARYTTNFDNAAGDHVMIYGDPVMGVRSGIFIGMNASGLFVTLLGGGGSSSGNTYTLTDLEAATNAYHTHILAYDPKKATVSYYFDGRLIAPDFGPQIISGANGVQFGSASSAAKGEMNYNLFQMDVVNAAAPVVAVAPKSSTNGVGQKVTFIGSFQPWVNYYQWLSNDVPIVGATATNFTTGFTTLANDGDQYKLKAYSAFGNFESPAARLTVTSDTNPPTIVSFSTSPTQDRVRITFSEPVLEATALDPANYVWQQAGVTTLGVYMVDPMTYEIRTTPFTAGNNYTLKVSNIRDTSNLTITSNTPVSLWAPTLSVLARYYAGTPSDSPAGPPDPTSAAGGGWTHFMSTDPLLTTNAIVNDNGWNAWEVNDPITDDTKQFNYYYLPLSAEQNDVARRFGWVLNVRAKLIDGNTSGVGSIFAQYEDDRFYRCIMDLAFDTAADLRVGLGVSGGFQDYVVTSGGTGFFDYHLHQIAYDPGTATASYYFDGALIKSAWAPVYIGPNSVAAPLWGAFASTPKGDAYFNLVELSVINGPVATVGLSGSNVNVTYRGVLEAASDLNTSVWAPIATNLTSEPVVLSIPTAGTPQQFFRARNP